MSIIPRYDRRILEVLDPDWKSRVVRIVTFPAPPVSAKGVIYPEDGWRSDTLERGVELFTSVASTGIIGKMSSRGPAFVVDQYLGDLVDDDPSTGTISIPTSTYCATISYASLFEDHHRFSTDVVLERVQPISQSCHPGSHSVVPRSPWLTLLLQLQRASSIKPSYVIADDLEGEELFPDVDFSMNDQIDRLFQYASVSILSSGESTLQISPIMSTRLRTVGLTRLESNQTLWEKSRGIIESFIQMVSRRNELIKERYHDNTDIF